MNNKAHESFGWTIEESIWEAYKILSEHKIVIEGLLIPCDKYKELKSTLGLADNTNPVTISTAYGSTRVRRKCE